jgi:hypothetical protein
MAFVSHWRPNTMRTAPTTRRRSSIGTKVAIVNPRTTISTVRATIAALAPASVERHWRVTPTARTTVSASTNSTVEAMSSRRP